MSARAPQRWASALSSLESPPTRASTTTTTTTRAAMGRMIFQRIGEALRAGAPAATACARSAVWCAPPRHGSAQPALEPLAQGQRGLQRVAAVGQHARDAL